MAPPPTRRELLLAGAGGAVLAPAGALLAPAAARAADSLSAPVRPLPEPERLERLIGIESLLLFCYESILGASILSRRARRLIAPAPAQEQAHIHALARQLTARGGRPPSPPADAADANRRLAKRNVSGRLGQLQGEPDAISLLARLEQVTIGAYFVALRELHTTALIVLAAQIMANDAQHEAILRLVERKGTLATAAPYGLVQGLQ